MPYFIYNQVTSSIYKIAENESDLSALNLPSVSYLTVPASQEDFNAVKLNLKYILDFNGVSNRLVDSPIGFNKEQIIDFINKYKSSIDLFLKNNPQSNVFSRWNNYLNYLNSLNIDLIFPPPTTITTQTLEQYIQNTGNPFYCILQLP